MDAEIISVGTELLLGDIINTNSQFLSRELAAYGINILYQTTVGDNAERLKGALEQALGRSELVLLTGGLGPTEDDLTRETVAAYFGLELKLDEESEKRIKDYFRSTGREYTENNRKQAMLPVGCTIFKNDHGTAPGCAVEKDGKHVILLPGPPRELIPLFSEEVTLYLDQFSQQTIRSHTIGVFGLTESTVDGMLEDLMKGSNPTVAPYAKDGEVVLRVTAKASSEEEADALCAPLIEEIRLRLGDAVYGEDESSLQKTVVTLLKDKKMKIATAESCTAGLLSGRLTEVPGVSQVFECGIAAYSKEIKHQVLGVSEAVLAEKGAISPETAAAMAIGARKVGGADIGIGITGVAGPSSDEAKEVGTVYVALADAERVWVKRVFAGHGWSEEREHIRYVATSHALDMARRYLQALPDVLEGGQIIEEVQSAADALPAVEDHSARNKKIAWIAALCAVVVLAAILTYAYIITPYSNRKTYDAVRVMYTEDDGTPEEGVKYPGGITKPFMSLYRTNRDVRAWVSIAGTSLNYPVVLEEEDGFYDKHDFYKNSSSYGTPHFKAGTTVEMQEEDRSLVIYGNNNDSEQMFAPLTLYTRLSYLQEHPVIEMNTLFNSGKYKIFAIMIVGTEERYSDNFDFTVRNFETEDEFLGYVAQIRQRSLFDTPTHVDEGDRLLMLTAPIDYGFDGARIVVAARRVRAEESEEAAMTHARENSNVLMPLAWQIRNGDITAQTVTTTTTIATQPSDPTTAPSTTEGTGTSASKTGGSTTKTTPKSQKSTKITKTTTKATSATSEQNQGGNQLIDETSEGETTTTTKRPPVDDTKAPNAKAVVGKIDETEFLKYFKVKNNNGNVVMDGQDENGVVEVTTKEQLQYVLSCIVKSELGSASTMAKSTEAQKAQAVASYSYILYYNKAYGTPYPINAKVINLNNKTDKKIYDAVCEVAGYKLVNTSKTTVKNMLCQAFYSAATGGYTSSSNKVWTGTLAFANSVSSPYDNELIYVKYGGMHDFVNKKTITRDELYDAVRKWFKNYVQNKYPAYTLPEEQFITDDSKLPFYAQSYDGDGTPGKGDMWNYVYYTNFYYQRPDGSKVHLTGFNMRTALDLRSHAFRVAYDASTKKVTITTQGWGHGVGLSQMGAVGYANEAGWNYLQILWHYFSVTDKTSHQIVAPKW